MTQTMQIARLIRDLRQEKGMTQSELAEHLNTSQSAVNRMEAGKQNFSLEMVQRISEVFDRELITLSDGSMNFRIEGGRPLSGEITTRVSKNATVGLLAASLLNKGTTVLKKAPRIEEVARIAEVLESIGVKVEWSDEDLVIKPPKRLQLNKINKRSAEKTRTIIMFLAPLMHAFNKFTIPAPGGCKLGSRTVMPHIEVLGAFGLNVKSSNGAFYCTTNPKQPKEVILYEPGDTVTENAIMAAALTPGKTTLKYVSANYAIQDLCVFLQQCGVKIEGIGSSTLTITGVKEINKDIEYYPSEDPIESMAFISIAIATKSELKIKRAPIEFLEKEMITLEHMNLKYEKSKVYKAENGYTKLVDITVYPSELKAPPVKIHALPYPGLNMDNLPFFAVIAACARGRTLIHDWSYENRAIYFTELSKLGANIELADPHRIFVSGPTAWTPADMTAPPALRPAAIIFIAMLAAKGTSTLRNVYSINRGYEDLAQRLNKLGANITII